MRKLFALFLVAAACSPAKRESDQGQSETSMAATLTEAQKSDGWRLIFDGQTMNGWKIFKDRKNNTWEVKDGTLHCKPVNEQVQGDGDERSDLMTTEEFENFEFAFDWKISAKGNSGVMFKVTEEFEQPYYSGPEYQMIDDTGYLPKPTDKQMTGANYDMHVVESKTLKPVGEWNSSKIVVNGNHVEHWLNGQKIVDYELNSEDWKKRKTESKWKEAAGYGMAKKGHLDLQDHGCEVWFRNLMVKTL
ncbi:MAG TPA: DUF1080 domain-containing protein [Cyclobacteriaceae bacterium]|nr:DUF1080 domain-containing protein [Cyclobacteriaceae bacterium]